MFEIYLILIVAGIIGFTITRRQFSFNSLYLSAYLFSGIACELLVRNYLEYAECQTYHIYQLLEWLFLSLAYLSAFKSKRAKKALKIIIPLVLCFLIIASFIDGLNEYPFFSSMIDQFSIVMLGLYFVYESYHPPFSQKKLIQEPFFWINTANLMFYSGSFFFYSLLPLIAEANLLKFFNPISHYLNLVLIALYIVGLLCQKIFK